MQDPEQPDQTQSDQMLAAQLAAEGAQENPPEQAPQEQDQGESITAHVKAELVQQLMDMGFSKIVSEKSLFLTQNASLENAMEWIDKHSEDPDFEEELRIVGTDTKASKPKYSDEERKQKAKELQEVIRKKRKEQEEALEKQREIDRIKGGKTRMTVAKQMMKAKREIQDAQLQRDIQKMKWEKKEEADAKARMLKLLEQDKASRFGKKGGGGDGSDPAKPSEPPEVTIKNTIKTIEQIYTEVRHPGASKLCFKTINLYLSNILKDPSEEKFRTINLENQGFKKRVGKLGGAIKILKAAGFETEGTKLVMHKADVERIKMAVKHLEGHF